MLSYHEYEKQIYDWLLSKNQNEKDFTFSLRRKANKGSELDYFIGTSKSNYFGTTFWTIHVSFPGSSSDCINLIFLYEKEGFKYKFEFKQTNSPSNAENESALNLLKKIRQPLIDEVGLVRDAKEGNKMFSMVCKSRSDFYKSLEEMISDINKDLGIIIPLVDDGINQEKLANPEFGAHRVSQSEFQNMQESLNDRLEKYKNFDFSQSNEIELLGNLKKTISTIGDSNALNKFFDAVNYVDEQLNFSSKTDNIYCAALKSRIHLTIGSRYVVSIKKTSKGRIIGFNIPLDLKEKLEKKYPSLSFSTKDLSELDNRVWVKLDVESVNLNDFLPGILQVAKVSFNGQSKSQFKQMYAEKHNSFILRAANDKNFRNSLYNDDLSMSDISNKENTNTHEIAVQPLNQILYGPPGTGKTYNTLLKAAEIVSNQEIYEYGMAQTIFNKHLGDQIEFITFHQNYSYEDFIQGLRPDIENNNSLTFDRKDGIFLEISKRALENLEQSEMETDKLNRDAGFNEALQKFIDDVEEAEEDFHIPDSVAYITEITDKAFRYQGKNWGHSSLMKFSDLRELFRADVKNRQDIKKLLTISGLANQHASYFLRVYNEIKKSLPSHQPNAERVEKKNYIIVIDEINRANISRVFGELITLIEPDKRSHGAIPMKCKLPSGEDFTVPSNLYIIGTMNTADKSIALLDIALRRRFVFESMYPKYEIPGTTIYDVDILEKINKEIIKSKGHDFQIGHAYFMNAQEKLTDRMNLKVIPLLLEYYMNDEKEVKNILSTAGLEVDNEAWPLKIIGRRD